MKKDVVLRLLTKVGRYEHKPQGDGPSSLDCTMTPSAVYKERKVSLVQVA